MRRKERQHISDKINVSSAQARLLKDILRLLRFILSLVLSSSLFFFVFLFL